MPELKLAKLPDRVPVKISISVPPDLYAALTSYAEAYQAAYDSTESVAELIPYMLAAFIESDGGFKKAKRYRDAAPSGASPDLPKSGRKGAPTTSTASSAGPQDIS